jgi:hypothetical protein
MRQLAGLREPGVEGLRCLLHIVPASGLEHVAALACEDHDVSISAAEGHRFHQPLVAEVPHAPAVGEVTQVLGPDDAEGADRSQRPALGAVQLVGAIAHHHELAFLPLREVEAAGDDVTRVIGALLAIARLAAARTSSATEARALVIAIPFRKVQVSWIVHGGSSTTPAWGRRA